MLYISLISSTFTMSPHRRPPLCSPYIALHVPAVAAMTTRPSLLQPPLQLPQYMPGPERKDKELPI